MIIGGLNRVEMKGIKHLHGREVLKLGYKLWFFKKKKKIGFNFYQMSICKGKARNVKTFFKAHTKIDNNLHVLFLQFTSL